MANLLEMKASPLLEDVSPTEDFSHFESYAVERILVGED